MKQVLLCATTEELMHPEMLGFDDVNLDSVTWLRTESQAQAARAALGEDESIAEVWAGPLDDMEGVNVAAAMRRDRSTLPIFLVADNPSGSLRSRAQAARLDGILSLDGLRKRFSEMQIDGDSGTTKAGTCAPEKSTDTSAGCPGGSGEEPMVQADNAPVTSSRVASSARVDVALSPTKQTVRNAGTKAAFVLSVLSGSGGSGKSTVSVACAQRAAMTGARVLLLDADLQFGDVAYMMGTPHALTLDDILENPDRLQDAATSRTAEGIAVLAAPKRLELSEALSEHIGSIIEAATAFFDIIVINTGASWTECHAAVIEKSDCALFLIDQKASSVRACKHAVDLCERSGIATAPFSYALNHCDRGALFTSIDVSCAMQGAHVFEIKEGGAEIEEYLGAGCAADMVHVKNEMWESIGAMLAEILPERLGSTRVSRTAAEDPIKRTSRRRGRKRTQKDMRLPGSRPIMRNDSRGRMVSA